jgi:Ni/Co efflux regulator RcnB
MAQLKVLQTTRLVLIVAAILTMAPAMADKPSSPGGGKHEKQRQNERHYDHDDRQGRDGDKSYQDRDRSNFSGGRYFIDRHKTITTARVSLCARGIRYFNDRHRDGDGDGCD